MIFKKTSLILVVFLLITGSVSVMAWHPPIPGVDIPFSWTFWDPDIPDYADDGDVYCMRELAAGNVYDHKRHLEWIPTLVEFTKQVTNMKIEIENQLKNLKALDISKLISQFQKLDAGLGKVLTLSKDDIGVMSLDRKAEDCWKETFWPNWIAQNHLTNKNYLDYTDKELKELDQSYFEALEYVKEMPQIEDKEAQLKELLESCNEAEGNKQISQSRAAIKAMSVSEKLTQEQLLSYIASILAVRAQSQKQQELINGMYTHDSLTSVAGDPYKLPQKDCNNKEVQGKGFKKF